MDSTRSKKSLLTALCLLALAGCATSSPQPPADTALEPTSARAPAPAPVLPAAPNADDSVIPADSAVHLQNPELYPDVWSRMRAGFAMKPLSGNLVEVHERWFASNPQYMARMTERARIYLHHILNEVEKRGLPTELALLPAIESAYQPYAYSRARAVGLWQFIAPTGRLYGLKMNWWYDGRRDVEASTQAALDYLEKLYNEFDGDWHLALAAYNAGEGKINRMIQYNRSRGRPTDYQSLKLRRETINYVPKLQAMANIVANPEKYGVVLADIPNKPYFAKVQVGSQVDLGVLAKLTSLSLDELQVMNPGFTRWATDPDGPHTLLVPVDKHDEVVEALNNLPDNERVQYRAHQVRRGETLSEISRRYGVSVAAIRSTNRMTSNLLRTNQNLLIPVSTRTLPPVTPVKVTATSVTAEKQPLVHIVRSGDTLSSIARRYGVLVKHLAEWNLLHTEDILRLGQRLKIWAPGGPSVGLPGAPRG
jgi:membrane-bound lytic murein transglycosylase D